MKNKNNKGFAIIETIIVVVMMTTSLLLLYSSYNSAITNEKKRIYYDDVVDLYKVNEIKNYILENARIDDYLTNIFKKSTSLTAVIGSESSLDEKGDLFVDPDYLKKLFEFYDIYKLFILETNYEFISSCTYEDIYDIPGDCMDSFSGYIYDEIDYIKSLGSNTDLNENDIILVAVFNTSVDKKYTYSYIMLEEYNENE